MITWSLMLSGQQIALLKHFSTRVEGKDFGSYVGEGVHPNTIPGTRALVREGLLEHREVRDKNHYIVVTRSGHFITERGRFILSMIETDIDKFLSAEKQLSTKRALKRPA